MSADPSSTASAAPAMELTVADMSCGHCAQTVKAALERGLPGTAVEADAQSKRVSVAGSTDRAAAIRLVAEAGYTAR
ncbi:heavy-metal-associated domain-containing protein [Bosea sp. TWI1241]|uniref:heavy-metal-associated domain-containing protein n=1 Tax=Bosea sp. TWI1241 TaxID=3148904 RepID=UPI00320B8937